LSPADDPQVARVLLNKMRLERTRQFGACFPGLELWKRLELDRFFELAIDHESADAPWSRVAALDDLREIEQGKDPPVSSSLPTLSRDRCAP
jgi:hypothetical protein